MAVFQYTNVAEYSDVLGLFDTTMKTYGRIDHAVAGAGIGETGNPFDPALTMESVREVGPFVLSQRSVYVNEIISGTIYKKRRYKPAWMSLGLSHSERLSPPEPPGRG